MKAKKKNEEIKHLEESRGQAIGLQKTNYR